MDLVAVRQDDCFALLCPRLTRSQVPLVANRLAGFLADVVVTGQDQKIAVKVSIGWAEAAEGDDADRLLDRARAAMEAAQAAGGDRSYLHNEHWPEPLQVEQVIGSL